MVSRSVGAFSHCVFSLDGDTQPTLHDACCEVGRQAEQRDVTWKRVGVPRVSLMPDGRFTSAKIPRSLVFLSAIAIRIRKELCPKFLVRMYIFFGL